MLKQKAVIFDMDGVIFDSETRMFDEWKKVAAKYGFKDIEIPYPKCIGANRERGRQVFIDFYGDDFPYEKYRNEVSENFHKKYDNGNLPLKTGVRELLEFLKIHDYFVALASSTVVNTVVKEIKDAGLFSYFDRIVGGDMVKNSKPAPDIFLKAAENTEIPVSEIYVVEDSFNGIRAAKNAGMIPVMVPDMLKPDEEIKNMAFLVCENLLLVKDMLAEKE